MSITTENTVIETAISEIIDAALHMNLRNFEVDGGEVIIRHQGAGYSVRPVVQSRVAVRPDGLPVSILGMGPRSDVVVYEVRGPQHDETGDWVELRTPHRAMLYIAGLM